MKRQTGMLNAFVAGAVPLDPATERLIERRDRLLGPAYRLFYEQPLHFVRGEGSRLFDAEGRAYLDAYNNVAGVGHCHPHVVAQMAQQAATLATHTRYLHEAPLDYAERLLATMPAPLEHFMFTCTGSEANDLAVRIAQAVTRAEGIIVTENAYHGVTEACAGFSPALGLDAGISPRVRLVPAPDPGRPDAASHFAHGVRNAISDLAASGLGLSMMIVDTIFSTDGVVDGGEDSDRAADLLSQAVANVREAGGLFVADEVQAGFGRTGSSFWGFQRHGIVPDMVSMGKGMGNGYPVAGLALRHDLATEFGAKTRYFNTFGGNAVAATVASAVLDVLEGEGLQQNAERVGAAFRARLRQLGNRHPSLGEVRGAGLFIGVDIRADPDGPESTGQLAGRIVNEMRDQGVLISTSGASGDTLKIRPPLVFSESDTDEFIDALERVIK